MIPVAGMFRGLFLGSVLVWYSSSVWKTMDGYYNREFKKYMDKEKQARRFPADEELCPLNAVDSKAQCADQAAAAAPAAAAGVGPPGPGTDDASGPPPPAQPGGDTVSRDAKHAEWRRGAEGELRGDCQDGGDGDGDGDDDHDDTCPAPEEGLT